MKPLRSTGIALGAAIIATLGLAALATPALAAFSGTDVFIASVGRAPGANGSHWFTTAWIYNPSGSAANITVYFLDRNQANPSPPFAHDTIPTGDTRRYASIIENLFPTIQRFGALRITSDQPIVVTSRIYNLPSGGQDPDTQGQDYPGIPASFAIGNGQSTQLLGVYQTNPKAGSSFRYNFGWVETSGGTANVRVIAHNEDGSVAASKDYPTTAGYEVRYYAIEDLLPGIDSTDLRLELQVTGGTGKIVAVGSGVANTSNDATSFEMQFADSLLGGGGGAVIHDATLTGDGTAPNPLGIANGGVTDAKVANGIAYSKLAGAPTSLPPSGPAGGSLGGTYPNPTIAANAIGTTQLANSAVTDAKVATGIAYSKLAGAPTSLPPSGPAGGLLSGNYPNPGVRGGQVVVSLNGLRDNITLLPGANTSITPAGNALTIASNGLTLPYSASASSGSALFQLTNTGGGTGFLGNTANGIAVAGSSANGFGVSGVSGSNYGVYGQSSSNVGVYGQGTPGVWGHGIGNSYGVYGVSDGATGVLGSCPANIGVSGLGGAVGVYGKSTSGIGVQGESASSSSFGVYGLNTNSGVGVYAQSNAASTGAVYAYNTGGGRGVWAYSSSGYGVEGQSDTGYGVYCAGNGYISGSWAGPSDARLKRNVATLTEALSRVLALRGVTFEWRTDEFPARHFADGTQIGLIAQEVEPVLPEIVSTDLEGYKAIAYTKLIPVLVQAIKEQQATIEAQRGELDRLRDELAGLKRSFAEMERRLPNPEVAVTH